MWKTFADDCQFFDSFPHFALSFIDFNFYFCNHLEDKNNAFLRQKYSVKIHYLFIETN